MRILTDTHSHTVASTHAYSTVQELLQAAKQRDLQAFVVTDHAPPMPDAPHLWHFFNMKVIPRVIDNIAVLRGMEANIETGGINLPEQVKQLDFIIASFHEPVFAPASRLDNTRAMVAAIESGFCQVIGHPGNPKYPINVDEVILAAKANNVVLEINNSSFVESRKGSEKHCLHILERIGYHGWKVSVSSDAHISYQLGDFSQSINALETVGLGRERVVNATAQSLLAFLKEHDKPVASELQEWAGQFQE